MGGKQIFGDFKHELKEIYLTLQLWLYLFLGNFIYVCNANKRLNKISEDGSKI